MNAKADHALALRRVSFRYAGRAQYALSDVDLSIKPSSTVALIGSSGAGKTTLANLLLRFWDPDQGAITLNGRDLREYRLDELRRQIALVAQGHLFI